MHDVIVVGGGHNGLTCAAYLARAGQKVMVLEANPHVGGFCVTEELVPEAPGYRMNSYALDFMTTNITPSVVNELELSRFGLEWVRPDPYCSYLGPDGQSWTIFHDIDRTCASIAKLSKRDAVYYKKLMLPLIDLINGVVPWMQDHPTRPSPKTLLEIGRRLGKGRKSLAAAGRTMMGSPIEIMGGFEREEVRAFFAAYCTGTLGPLEEGANGSMFAHLALLHDWPLHRPVGGSGRFSDALEACVQSYGGEVRTAAPVEEITVRNGRATGVVLQSGEKFDAREVVAAIDPTTLFKKLVDETEQPDELKIEVDRMQVLRYGIGNFKGDIAMSKRPQFPRHTDLPENGCQTFILAPTVDYVRAALAAGTRGELPDTEYPFWFSMPSIPDRTLVPPGSEGEVGYLYSLTPPYEISDGTDWNQAKGPYLDKCLDHVEEYAPGLKDSIIGKPYARSPQDLNAPWANKGAIWGVDVVPSQMGPWRPSPSLAGFDTPIEHLWHTGPGAHPLPGVCGWGGRTAARRLLKRESGGRLTSLLGR